MEYYFKCDCGIIMRCQASNNIEGTRRLIIESLKHIKSAHSDIKMSESFLKKIGENVRKKMKVK